MQCQHCEKAAAVLNDHIKSYEMGAMHACE